MKRATFLALAVLIAGLSTSAGGAARSVEKRQPTSRATAQKADGTADGAGV